MTHQMTQPDKAAPEIQTGRAIVHIVGPHTGQIRVDCELPSDYTVDDLFDHFRLALPGETSLLIPQTVVENGNAFTVAFFSSDITNSGHLPAECSAVWVHEDGTREPLQPLSVEDAGVARESEGEAAVELPDTPESGYPRTVVIWVIAMLCLGIVTAGTLLFS